MDYTVLIAVLSGLVILLILILRLKLPAFLSLLIASISVGIISGMSPTEIFETIKVGMGSTLGFVATVVGLGAMFGALLEQAGGAEAIAKYTLGVFGPKRTSWALMITGFIVAIPVFFDVAFIILIPIIYSLQRSTGKSILYYGIPLLAGLAITHTFIPPTPGPVAVADILDVDLGWVILMGAAVSIPTAVVCGPIFGKYIAEKIMVKAPEQFVPLDEEKELPPIGMLMVIIAVPIVLIVLQTTVSSPLVNADQWNPLLPKTIAMLGHPFSALIIANLIAWYVLGIKRKVPSSELLKVSRASFGPAGLIILLTGAGGVFKQMLINTNAGKMLADYFADLGFPILILAFIIAALVRVLQGSATVAMITSASIMAPLVSGFVGAKGALLVVAIASGASILSHVNDSGFWLVSNYLGLDERQTFKSWSVMTTILALTGISCVLILDFVFSMV